MNGFNYIVYMYIIALSSYLIPSLFTFFSLFLGLLLTIALSLPPFPLTAPPPHNRAIVVCSFNPSSQEAEAGLCRRFRVSQDYMVTYYLKKPNRIKPPPPPRTTTATKKTQRQQNHKIKTNSPKQTVVLPERRHVPGALTLAHTVCYSLSSQVPSRYAPLLLSYFNLHFICEETCKICLSF